jgi:hypothetical protein
MGGTWGKVVFLSAIVVVGVGVVVGRWLWNMLAMDGSRAKTAAPVNAVETSTIRESIILAITSLLPMLDKKLSASFCRTFHCVNAGVSVLFATTTVNDLLLLLPLGRLLLDVTISEASETRCSRCSPWLREPGKYPVVS